MALRLTTALIFFISGAATLIYQVVWQRVLTQEIGVDFVSMAIIVTIFMIGLGLGAVAGGVVAAWCKKQLQYIYVGLEAAIGLFGIASIYLLRTANQMANSVLGIQSVFLDFVVNAAVLIVPITLMGMTTPIIIEYMKTRLERVGSIVGIYYGVNVFGAALGAVLTGIYLIELYGLFNTTVIAAGLNVVCSVGFLLSVCLLPKRVAASRRTDSTSIRRLLSFAGIPRSILLASFLFGFVTLSMEMILFRIIANYFTPWPPLFAFMLAVFLLMLAAGEFISGTVVDRIKEGAIWVMLLVLLSGTVAATLIELHIPLLYIYQRLGIDQFAVYNHPIRALLLIGAFMIPVLFAAGFLPVIVKISTRDIADVGSTFAVILFMFTLGNIAGSYVTAIWLFETLHTLGALALCTAITGIGIFAIYRHAPRRRRYAIAGISCIAVLALAAATPWQYFMQSNGYLRDYFKSTGLQKPDVAPVEVFEDKEAVTVVVPDAKTFHFRPFWGNSALATTDKNVGVSVWSLSHLRALDPEFRPKRVLQIGVGGNQFAYAMKEWSSIEKVTVVELNEAVLRAHQKYSHPDIGGLIKNSNPKVEYVHLDGRRYVQKALARGARFDFVQIGVNNLKQVGTNNIYSLEFFREVKKLLTPDGYVGLFSYTGLARLGLELWDHAILFPDAQNWVIMTSKALPPNGATLPVSEEVARFYTAGGIDQLARAAPNSLTPLRVHLYSLGPFFAPYEVSTDDNLSYEYWMLRTRRKDYNNPEIYLWNQTRAPHEERTYPLCIAGVEGCGSRPLGEQTEATAPPEKVPADEYVAAPTPAESRVAIIPFVEALDPRAVARFELFRDDPGYVSRLRDALGKAAVASASSNDPLPGAEELVPDDRAGGMVLRQTRKYKYHANIPGMEGLPLTPLNGAKAVSVNLRYEVDHPNRIYWELIWCDQLGHPLANLDPYYLRIMVGAEKPNRTVDETFEHIPVPQAAQTVRVNIAFSPDFTLALRKLEVTGYVGRRTLAAGATISESQRTGHTERREVQFAPYRADDNEAPPLIGRGVEMTLHGSVVKGYRLDYRNQVENLPLDRTTVVSRFECPSMIIEDSRGHRREITVPRSDYVEIMPQLDGIRIRSYQYHFAERLFETLAPSTNTEGRNVNHNLGVTRTLPKGESEIQVTEEVDSFVCPVWQPGGRLATLIFTEHADLVSLNDTGQILFGNDQQRIQSGSGFVGNHLPITMTLFALGPASEVPIEGVTYHPQSLEGSPALATMLRGLRAAGYPIEIGLHTPSSGNDSPQDVLRALKTMKDLGSDIWIDHGLIGNLESLARHGWNPRQPQYLVDKLNEYGYRYAWAATDKYLSRLSLIRPGVASNLLFTLPMFADENDNTLTLFGTVQTQLARIGDKDLDALIADRGVSILHIYLELYSITDGRLNDRAKTAISRIAEYRDRGDLYVATLKEWAEYVQQLSEVRISRTDKGVQLESTKGGPSSASFVIRPIDNEEVREIAADGNPIAETRIADGAHYVWLDIPARATELQWSGHAGVTQTP